MYNNMKNNKLDNILQNEPIFINKFVGICPKRQYPEGDKKTFMVPIIHKYVFGFSFVISKINKELMGFCCCFFKILP